MNTATHKNPSHHASESTGDSGPGFFHQTLIRLEKITKRLSKKRVADERAFVRCFHGYGFEKKAILRGRVELKRELRHSDIDDSKRRNFMNMAANFFTKEIPGATVEGSADGNPFSAVCDDEGYFTHELSLSKPFSPDPELTFTAYVSDGTEELTPLTEETQGLLSICPEGAERIIISDIDDTVMETGAVKIWQLLRNTLLENVHTRKLFPGVSAFYRKLQKGPEGNSDNPIFYVTSSPWNLRDFILKVFELREIPRGPLFMNDWGLDETKVLKAGHSSHKLTAIRHLLDFHAPLPAILIGDSGEKDPEIYAQVVKEYPGRIDAVFIRDVTEKDRDQKLAKMIAPMVAQNIPFYLVETTDEAELRAKELNLVN